MKNFDSYTNDMKFHKLSNYNQKAIVKLDKILCEEGYIFNGNWRDDPSSDGFNSSFELINSSTDRKNLITIRPMKNFLKIEVYWGYSKSLSINRKPKVYFKIMPNGDVPISLLMEVRELHNLYF